MKKVVILTGATGGLGQEFLRQILQEEIDEVWAIARNDKKLSELKAQYGEKVVQMSLDLSELAEIKKVEAMLKEQSPLCQVLNQQRRSCKNGKIQ